MTFPLRLLSLPHSAGLTPALCGVGVFFGLRDSVTDAARNHTHLFPRSHATACDPIAGVQA